MVIFSPSNWPRIARPLLAPRSNAKRFLIFAMYVPPVSSVFTVQCYTLRNVYHSAVKCLVELYYIVGASIARPHVQSRSPVTDGQWPPLHQWTNILILRKNRHHRSGAGRFQPLSYEIKFWVRLSRKPAERSSRRRCSQRCTTVHRCPCQQQSRPLQQRQPSQQRSNRCGRGPE